jgi:hypothetical protein
MKTVQQANTILVAKVKTPLSGVNHEVTDRVPKTIGRFIRLCRSLFLRRYLGPGYKFGRRHRFGDRFIGSSHSRCNRPRKRSRQGRGTQFYKAKRIADLARTYNIPVATHNVMGPVATIASANCVAAIQDFLGHESFDFKNGNRAGEGDLIVYDREIVQDGYIHLSDKPGLGLEINRDFASKVSDGWRNVVGLESRSPATG